MTIGDAVEKFLLGYFGTSNRSLKTKAAYTFDLGQLRDFLGPEAAFASVEPEKLESWARAMQARPYAIASIRRKFAAARVLFSYWVRRGAIVNSPMWRIRLSLGKEQALPRSLSPTDSRLLIEEVWRASAMDSRNEVGSSAVHRSLRFRDIAMIETLFATGIRVGELVKLRLSDWRAEDTCFLVRGKGGKERLAFLPDERSLQAIKAYIRLRDKLSLQTEAVFVNATGKAISEQGVALTLARIARNACISRKVTPHMIRHTVATLLLRYGADIRIVQEVLGHASINTTQRYVHVAKDHLLETLRKRHPSHHLNINFSQEALLSKAG
jgi:site-specific recombinase XerD